MAESESFQLIICQVRMIFKMVSTNSSGIMDVSIPVTSLIFFVRGASRA